MIGRRSGCEETKGKEESGKLTGGRIGVGEE